MYKVKTEKTTYQRIINFNVWKIDINFLIFNFDDGEILILKKDLIISITGK